MASKTTVSKTSVSRTSAQPPARPPYWPQPELDYQEGEPVQPLPSDGDEQPVDVSPVTPVGVEQLERSREMETMGVEAWKAAHDERDSDQQPQSVAGVGWAPAPGETYGGNRSR